jgi:hypothetical protein
MSPFYDKKMKIVTHIKNGSNVLHGAVDYCMFKANGTYEQNWTGTTKTGTWTHNPTDNTITVTVGTATTTYTLNASGSTRMGLTNSTEELVLTL